MTCPCGWPIYSTVRATITCPNCGARVQTEGDELAPPLSVELGPGPAWVRTIRRLRKPEDRGVGDTVARLLGRFGERFKGWSKRIGIPCGCTARQAEWNARWPYQKETPQ